MRSNFKSAVAAGVMSLAIGGVLVTGSGAAFASPSAPAWEPDPQAASYGNVVFYDASGNEITSGTNLDNLFAYAAGTTHADANVNSVYLSFANPNSAEPTAQWTATSENVSTAYPVTSPPADVAIFQQTYPVSDTSGTQGGDTGADLTTWLQSNSPSLTAGYANIVQVRLTDEGARNAGNNTKGTYWESDIAYNTGGSAITVDGVNVPAGSWVQLFPALNTSPNLQLAAASSGNQVTLNATVSPALPGLVQFYDNGTAFGAPVSVSGGTAGYTGTPAATTDSFTASFIPTVGDETGSQTTGAAIYPQVTSPEVTAPVATTPESPLAVLLPTSAIVIGAAGILFGRRRRRNATQD